MFGVGCIADETRHVRELVEATSAKARFAHGEVQSKVATLVAQADASASRTVEETTGCGREVAAYSDVQASCITAEVTQRLESEIQATVMSTAMTANVNTCTTVEGVHQDV